MAVVHQVFKDMQTGRIRFPFGNLFRIGVRRFDERDHNAFQRRAGGAVDAGNRDRIAPAVQRCEIKPQLSVRLSVYDGKIYAAGLIGKCDIGIDALNLCGKFAVRVHLLQRITGMHPQLGMIFAVRQRKFDVRREAVNRDAVLCGNDHIAAGAEIIRARTLIPFTFALLDDSAI